MTQILITAYQLVAVGFNLVIPTAMLLGICWLFVKMGKGFYRSITK